MMARCDISVLLDSPYEVTFERFNIKRGTDIFKQGE